MTAPRLYHFTCEHGHARIQAGGSLIVPQGRHPVAGWRLSWFTTLREPDRFRTGLTAVSTTCDRMARRYVIEPGNPARAWLFSGERMRAGGDCLLALEGHGDPEHWWISAVPVAAALDPAWTGGDR